VAESMKLRSRPSATSETLSLRFTTIEKESAPRPPRSTAGRSRRHLRIVPVAGSEDLVLTPVGRAPRPHLLW
jgi:hypothetical protein